MPCVESRSLAHHVGADFGDEHSRIDRLNRDGLGGAVVDDEIATFLVAIEAGRTWLRDHRTDVETSTSLPITLTGSSRRHRLR